MKRFFAAVFFLVAVVTGSSMAAEGSLVPELVKEASPSVVRLEAKRYDGSAWGATGFIIRDTKYVVTSYHVVEGAKSLSITLPSKATLKAVRVYSYDKEADLAIIEVEGEVPKGLSISEEMSVKTGEDIVVIGNPLGLENTVTQGIVSALRESDGVEWIQMSASISPGSSGGPILSLRGEVVGVVSWAFVGGSTQNLNFGVSTSHLATLLKEEKPLKIGQIESQEKERAPKVAVKTRTCRSTDIYAQRNPVLGMLPKCARIQLLATNGNWCKVRYVPVGGKPIEGLVHAGALVKNASGVEALRDARIYATTRPVLCTVPGGAEVEVLDLLGDWYLVRHSSIDAEPVKGLVRAIDIESTEDLKKVAAERAKVEAEARAFEALYQGHKHKYALVNGEYVKLPPFPGLFDKNGRPCEKCAFCGGHGRITCPKCAGTGRVQAMVPCSHCGGKGYIEKFSGKARCPSCGGSGKKRGSELCGRCNGRGIILCQHCEGTGRFVVGILSFLDIGHYGQVPYCEILQILSPNEMLVIWGDDRRILHMTGWDTSQLADEDALGLEVAIIGTKKYTTVRGASSTVYHAIPLGQVRRGLTRTQFQDLLKQKR